VQLAPLMLLVTEVGVTTGALPPTDVSVIVIDSEALDTNVGPRRVDEVDFPGTTIVNFGVTSWPCGTDVGATVGGGFDVVPLPPPPPPHAASVRTAARKTIVRIWTFAPCVAGFVIGAALIS
jgi:hypothetical protein